MNPKRAPFDNLNLDRHTAMPKGQEVAPLSNYIVNAIASIVALAVLSEFSVPQSHANLLVNSGFETSDFTGWSVGGTNGGSGVAANGTVIPGTAPVFGTAAVLAHSGDYAAFAVTAADAGESLTLSQTLNLSPGGYNLGFWMGNHSSAGFGVIPTAVNNHLLGIIVNGTPLTLTFNPPLDFFVNFPPITTSAQMEEVASQFVSSGGSTTIEFSISGSGSVRAGISVDDFFVNGPGTASVPEPTTLALLSTGIGLTGIAIARRRRASPKPGGFTSSDALCTPPA
jgi:hypothetical protein